MLPNLLVNKASIDKETRAKYFEVHYKSEVSTSSLVYLSIVTLAAKKFEKRESKLII